MSTAYPRDLIGYGRRLPHAGWPRGGRIALQFVLNYEEGAESCVLHGDAASEVHSSEIIGAQPFPAPSVVDNEYWTVRPVDDQPPLRIQLLEAVSPHETRDRCVHEPSSSATAFAEALCACSLSI